jgi:ABC-type phosphate transport system substrate-binding protein
MRIVPAIVVVLCLALTPALAASRAVVFGEASGVPPFLVIVNPDVTSTALDRKFLQDAFLKKVTRWPDGAAIHPADLTPSSAVRRRFSEDVLNRSVDAVRSYWQQRIFSGRDVPPPELDSDDEAVAYVLKHEGGIAYVSGSTKLNGARVVTVR